MTKILSKAKNAKGSATIEAVVAFTGFMFTIFTVLNIVNFCRTQALVSNAIDTVAKEMSQYGYFYKMSGLQKFSQDMSNVSDVGSDKINEVIGNVDGLYTSLSGAVDNSASRVTEIKNAVDDKSIDMDTIQGVIDGVEADGSNVQSSINLVSASINSIIANPISYIKSLVAVAANGALDAAKSRVIAVPLAKAFFVKHFGDSQETASEHLKNLGVVNGLEGMNFNNSTMFCSDSPNDIHIVVYYKLQLIQLFEIAELQATIKKEALVGGWLGGDDVIAKIKQEPATTVPAETDESTGENSENTSEPSTEETTSEETTKVDTEGSYWHLDANGKIIAVNTGSYQSGIGRDVLHHMNGNYQIQVSDENTLKNDRPKQLFQSYTITKGNDDTDSLILLSVIGGLKSIETNLEAYDGDEKVERTLYYEIYVPENISDADMEKLEKEVKEAESNLDIHMKAANGENSEYTTAKNAEYEIRIIKSGGNYDYGG